MAGNVVKKIQRDNESLPISLVQEQGPSIAEHVKQIESYDPVSSLTKMLERPEMEHFKLDWNEATIPPSPKVRHAIHQYLDGQIGLNIYPMLFSNDLRLRLQAHVGYPSDHIIVTNGSDDALDLICRTYLNPDEKVICPYPTYTHFILHARSRGAQVVKLTSDDLFNMTIDEILAAVTPDTKIIYLVNPNNPTGQTFEPEDIAKIARQARHAVVLVDEAYAEFAGISAVSLVGEFENVVVSRSFSKAYGLAGLRIGYLVAQPAMTKELMRLYNPKSVNQIAQVAAMAVLDDLPYYERYIEEVGKSKALFGRWCGSRGIHFRATPANFVLIQVERVKEVVAGLAEEGVYVRDRSGFTQLPNTFRLNLGTLEQTTEVIRRFERVLKRLEIIE